MYVIGVALLSRGLHNELHERGEFGFALSINGPQTYLRFLTDLGTDQGGKPWKAKCGA